jgi:hypothetical protein
LPAELRRGGRARSRVRHRRRGDPHQRDVNTQKIQTLYGSTPHWSWWVGHGIFGATLGLLSSVLLEKRGASHPEAPLTVNDRCDAALR